MCGRPCREESPCLHQPECGSALLTGSCACAGGRGTGLSNQLGESCGVQHPESSPFLGRGGGVQEPTLLLGRAGVVGLGPEKLGLSFLRAGPLSALTSPQLQHLPHAFPRCLSL